MENLGHILVVEDEAATRELLVTYFEKEGYRVSQRDRGEGIAELVESDDIDLLLLDIRLPGKDGLELTRDLRAACDVGIILVTSRKDEIDRIVGLELGADDYITKPFNTRELLARTKNLLRRVRASSRNQVQAPPAQIRFEGWQLDTFKHQLRSPAGEEIALTEGEYKVLLALSGNPGRVMSRDQLLDALSGRSHVAHDRTVDVMIARIRRKLDDDPQSPQIIRTVHGGGYMFTGTLDER